MNYKKRTVGDLITAHKNSIYREKPLSEYLYYKEPVIYEEMSAALNPNFQEISASLKPRFQMLKEAIEEFHEILAKILKTLEDSFQSISNSLKKISELGCKVSSDLISLSPDYNPIEHIYYQSSNQIDVLDETQIPARVSYWETLLNILRSIYEKLNFSDILLTLEFILKYFDVADIPKNIHILFLIIWLIVKIIDTKN